MSKTFLGIEIGGTKLQIVAGENPTRILKRYRFGVDRNRGGEGIRAQLESALKEIVPDLKPTSIGVGFGGPVDRKTGRICRSHQIEGWSDFDLGGWLTSFTRLPVCV
ncbi:MAG TPA: ROK family protein, partial [Candidatus Nitrosotalea sp.]|nr:ROK family protein [Candidatus Nitrosotalea sp.]